MSNLTLTSVVFEFEHVNNAVANGLKFNFNKCCIWIWDGLKVDIQTVTI